MSDCSCIHIGTGFQQQLYPGRTVNAFFMLGLWSLVSRQVRQIGAEEIDDLGLEITMKLQTWTSRLSAEDRLFRETHKCKRIVD